MVFLVILFLLVSLLGLKKKEIVDRSLKYEHTEGLNQSNDCMLPFESPTVPSSWFSTFLKQFELCAATT